MAISAVGSFVTTGATGAGTTATRSFTPGTAGNGIACAFYVDNGTTITGIASSNATWARTAGPFALTAFGNANMEIWVGTATSTSTAIATVTFSASVAGSFNEFESQEFTAGLGAGTVWAADGTYGTRANTASTTLTYPTLTPSAAGRLYFGKAVVASGTPTAGSTSGFTYPTTASADPACYNPNVSAVVTPTQPNSGSVVSAAIGVLLSAGLSTVAKSGSDSGAGSESGVVAAAVAGSDSGTGSGSGTVALLQTGADSGAGSESGFVAIPQAGSDSGSGSSTGSIGATVTSGDTAAGTSSGSIAANTTGADTGTGSSAGFIRIPGADSGHGADVLGSLHATVTSSDSGAGSDGGYVEALFGDLNISIYGVDPATGGLVALPDYQQLTFSRERNSAGSITFDYPTTGLNFALLRDTITSDRDLEFEIWSIGSPIGALRGYLQEASGDDVADAGKWTFAGGFLELRVSKAVVYPQPLGPLIPDDDDNPDNDQHANEKQELTFTAATPGEVGLIILGQAQDRGTLTDLTAGFTTTHDSNGTAWPNVISTKFSPGAPYDQVLNQLVNFDLAEWAITWTGTTKQLDLWIPEGRGLDRTTGPRPIVLRRGRNLVEAPRKWSVRDAGTTVLAAGAEGFYEDASDATALARRGRRIEVFVSANNIANSAAVEAFAQQQLQAITAGTLEVTHGLGFLPGEPRPLIAFDIGDWVYSQTGTELERLRVVQFTLTVDPTQNPSGTVTLNDTMQDALVRLQGKLNALAGGDTVVGTSTATSTQDTVPPAAPTGLIGNSIAYQDEADGTTYARVTLGWDPVTTNANGTDSPLVQAALLILDRFTDGDPILEDWTWAGAPDVVGAYNDALLTLYGDSTDTPQVWLTAYIVANSGTPTVADDVSRYRVQYAYLGINQVGPPIIGLPDQDLFWYEPTPYQGTPGTSFTFGGVGAGVDIALRVAAFDNDANQGPWSDRLEFTTEVDNTPPPVPGAPTLSIWFRTVDITSDGLGSEGEAMPFDWDHNEVWLSQGATITGLPDTASDPTAFDPTETGPQHVANLFTAGTWNQPDLPIGVGWYAALRSVDRSRNVSELSAMAGPATAEQLVSQDLIDDIIDATKLGPNSVASSSIIDAAITSAKILDAAIVTAKIADLAVNDAKIDTLSAGKIVTGTLNATVTLTGIIKTLGTLHWEGDSAGIRFYNSAGTKTIDLQGAAGSILVTGTLQSALSGMRWVMSTSGDLLLYPTAGSAYSRLWNLGNGIAIRGPLDGSGRSGRINADNVGVGINFSAETDLDALRSEMVVTDRLARITAPVMIARVDGRFAAPSGLRRFTWVQTDSDGDDIGESVLNYSARSSDDRPALAGLAAGLVFGSDGMAVTTGSATTFGPVGASAFNVGSSEDIKTDIEDARAVIPDLLQMIRGARAQAYLYDWDEPGTPARFGPLVGDLPEVLRLPMTLPDGRAIEGVDLARQVGVIWGVLGQLLDQRNVLTTASVPIPTRLNADTDYDVTVPWIEGLAQTLPAPVSVVPYGPSNLQLRAFTATVVALTTTDVTVRFRAKRLVIGLTDEDHVVVNALYDFTPPYTPPEAP